MQEADEEVDIDDGHKCKIKDIKDAVFNRSGMLHSKYNASVLLQFQQLMYRAQLSYWRSPSYNFVRMMICAVVGLIFSSTYANQNYSSDVDTISRCAVIYMTTLFCGVIGMMSVQPVIFAERPAFYREQFSDMYDVRLYTLATTIVEVRLFCLVSLFI